jgi:hypothetical protein
MSRQSVPNPRAGVTLKAVAALTDPNVQHFTREQVAYLIHLAFLSGAEHRRAFDHAELIAAWDVNTTPLRTREQRIAWEMAEYERLADLKLARDAYADRVAVNPWPNCPWPEVAVPGGQLQAAA